MNNQSQGTRSRCKVEDLTDKYTISNLDQRIVEERQEEDASLRDLEAFVNQEVLKAAIKNRSDPSNTNGGMSLVEGTVENYYRLLTDDDVSPNSRRETERQLEQAGIDVEELRDDFVSYQTIRSHLQECLEISTSRTHDIDIDDTRDTFSALTARVVNVIERTLDRLRRHKEIQMGDPNVSVSVQVECDDCNRTYTPEQILKNRGCPCSHSEEPAESGVTRQIEEIDQGPMSQDDSTTEHEQSAEDDSQSQYVPQ